MNTDLRNLGDDVFLVMYGLRSCDVYVYVYIYVYIYICVYMYMCICVQCRWCSWCRRVYAATCVCVCVVYVYVYVYVHVYVQGPAGLWWWRCGCCASSIWVQPICSSYMRIYLSISQLYTWSHIVMYPQYRSLSLYIYIYTCIHVNIYTYVYVYMYMCVYI